MDLPALPFDADEMVQVLAAADRVRKLHLGRRRVNRMMRIAARDLAVRGARIRADHRAHGFGDCWRATFPHRRADEPGILVLGHLDTVHPTGRLEKLPFRRDGPVCY